MGTPFQWIADPAPIANQDRIAQCRLVFPFEKPANSNLGRLRLHNGVSQPASITVTVPARLHLGFLDLNGRLGRRFGGIGFAISDLKTSITIRRATRTEVSGPDSDRVRQYLQTIVELLALDGGHDVKISQAVPAHAGLGSGTQLALAVAGGMRRLYNRPLDVEGDAMKLGRGARSGIGIGLFHHGGFVVDGGRGPGAIPAPIVSRLPFPESWRIVVVLDPQRQGVHGPGEAATIGSLSPMPDADAAHICRLILLKALPALAEQDIVSFGSAIKELQERLGDYFSPVQGGLRFTSRDVAAVLETLDAAGAFGIGQSSWGPTGFAFAPSPEDADRFAAIARQHPGAQGLDIRVCKGLNHGAEIVAHTHARESSP
jgi:beta-ribofuranosylaminobenzene 5'-phosphate synthase